jgi:hypothetical protein
MSPPTPPPAPPPAGPPPIEPDPFKNARGLSGMFGARRGGGPPLWPFLLAAIGVLAVVALRIQVATEAKRERELDMQLQRELQKDMNGRFGGDPFGSPGGVPGDSLYGGGSEASAPSPVDVRMHADQVCSRLAACGPNAGDAAVVSDCVSQQMATAPDALGRTVLDGMLTGIIKACGDKPCAEFTTCYFDVVKKQSEGFLGPASSPTSPGATPASGSASASASP